MQDRHLRGHGLNGLHGAGVHSLGVGCGWGLLSPAGGDSEDDGGGHGHYEELDYWAGSLGRCRRVAEHTGQPPNNFQEHCPGGRRRLCSLGGFSSRVEWSTGCCHQFDRGFPRSQPGSAVRPEPSDRFLVGGFKDLAPASNEGWGRCPLSGSAVCAFSFELSFYEPCRWRIWRNSWRKSAGALGRSL